MQIYDFSNAKEHPGTLARGVSSLFYRRILTLLPSAA